MRSLTTVLLLGPMFVVTPAIAATLTVTSALDDGSPGTLRSQIAAASPGDLIDFAVTGSIVLSSSLVIATSDLTIDGPGRDVLAIDGGGVGRVLEVTSAATGVDASDLTIQNGFVAGASQGGGIRNAGGLTLRRARIIGNRADNGGGIYNSGTLHLNDVIVELNAVGHFSGSGAGGGLLNDGGAVTGVEVVIRDQYIMSIHAVGGMALANFGGVVDLAALQVNDYSEDEMIWNWSGTMTLSGSEISGGCYITNSGNLTIRQSVINGTSCEGSAGLISSGTLLLTDVDVNGFLGLGTAGLFLSGTATIERSLIRNMAGYYTTGGVTNSGNLLMVNSTISSNFGNLVSGFQNTSTGTAELYSTTITGDPSGDGAVIDNQGSITIRNVLIERATTSMGTACNFAGFSDLDSLSLASDVSCGLTAMALLLGPLSDNGGPTMTHALLPGSPAIDRAVNCTYDDDLDNLTPEVPVEKDQRGMVRFGGTACDAGAFEDEAVPVPVLPVALQALLALLFVASSRRILTRRLRANV